MTEQRKDEETVLVSWVSVNHRAAPILTALRDRGGILRGGVGKLYLCWRDSREEDGERERTALSETLAQLREELGGKCPEIERVPWKTSSPPTDHAAIRPFAEQTLQRIRKLHPAAHVLINVSPGTPAMHAVWLALGATGFIEGPLTLIQTADERARKAGLPAIQSVNFEIETYLRQFRKQRPRRIGLEDDGQLWEPTRVQSPALREVFKQLERWAPLRAPVLLLGERGTGKTTLAHFLRAMSPFQKEHKSGWPVVVCGQFRSNPQLARSELFGHIKGAFTGATADREGLLEKADGDTVFFDEIADIDKDTQRLLMAALEGRGFQRLGDNQIRHSRFRLIAATNRPIGELVRDVLDPDFYDRLAVFTLRVPALRECRADIPELWRSVLRRVAVLSEAKSDRWREYEAHAELLKGLLAHRLPSNIRDLQRVAFHLLSALAAGDDPQAATACALAALPSEDDSGMLPNIAELRSRLPLVTPLPAHLDGYRRVWVDAALAEAEGNQSEAARLLGVKRETMRDWSKES
jgi:DNA-binding NtrC family response regulator